jgi:DNA-binding transcriptional LysR family regulator
MDLRQLTHFVAVAEERQFTRAATRLHVVQSTLSASIGGLERELGTSLLIRNSRRVELTSAGRALLPAARRALAAAEDARAAVDAVRGLLSGHLAIGAVQALSLVDLSSLLARYHRHYPGISLTLYHSTIDGLVRGTVDGDLDLAFVNRPFDSRRVNELLLGAESLVLAVSRDDPLARERVVALTDLEHRDFVGCPKEFTIRTRVDTSCAAVGLHHNICCETDTLSDLVDLVRGGLGVAFLPPSIVKNADRVVAVRTEPAIPWELAVVTSSERPPAQAAAAFLDMLRERL